MNKDTRSNLNVSSPPPSVRIDTPLSSPPPSQLDILNSPVSPSVINVFNPGNVPTTSTATVSNTPSSAASNPRKRNMPNNGESCYSGRKKKEERNVDVDIELMKTLKL